MLDEDGALLTGTEDNNVYTAYAGASLWKATGAGGYTIVNSVVGNKENLPCRWAVTVLQCYSVTALHGICELAAQVCIRSTN